MDEDKRTVVMIKLATCKLKIKAFRHDPTCVCVCLHVRTTRRPSCHEKGGICAAVAMEFANEMYSGPGENAANVDSLYLNILTFKKALVESP